MTVPEATQLITEAILEHASIGWPPDPRDPAAPRLCVVLEEAHSLVPEGGFTSDRNESGAAAKSARAVLQGRKFGVGCLLITQRTANVTKTILNQCHTVFAMRSFDETSERFLANYMGRDYAALLPSLREQQAVLFGRGSTSEAPILIELNDRDVFRAQWAESIALVPSTRLAKLLDGPSSSAPADSAARAGADVSTDVASQVSSAPSGAQGAALSQEAAESESLDDLPF